MMISKQYQSPNYSERNHPVSMIVIHYTEYDTVQEAAEVLCSMERQVSSHYLITRTGEIYSLVDEQYKAWHAGVSYWRGREAINEYSIGIELDNNGNEVFSDELMKSLIWLCKDIQARYEIEPYNIVAHSDVAPNRKVDPGAFFNWRLLAENGIGIYPEIEEIKELPDASLILEFQRQAKIFGYKIEETNILDEQTEFVLRAFNLRFDQKNTENKLTSKTIALLNALNKICHNID